METSFNGVTQTTNKKNRKFTYVLNPRAIRRVYVRQPVCSPSPTTPNVDRERSSSMRKHRRIKRMQDTPLTLANSAVADTTGTAGALQAVTLSNGNTLVAYATKIDGEPGYYIRGQQFDTFNNPVGDEIAFTFPQAVISHGFDINKPPGKWRNALRTWKSARVPFSVRNFCTASITVRHAGS